MKTYVLSSIKTTQIGNKQPIELWVSGVIFPRLSTHGLESGIDLITRLWEEYGFSFIDHIKGSFLIYLHTINEQRVFTDHFGLCKVFYRLTDGVVQVSDNVHDFTEKHISEASYAVFSTMYHHTGGLTPYNNIHYLKPGHYLRITDKLEEIEYWNPLSLIPEDRINVSSREISDQFYHVIDEYIKFIKPKSVSLTLTGGYDSRIILAALKKCGVETTAYTYGDPESIDNFIAEKIAMDIGIKHFNYNLGNPPISQVERYSRYIAKDAGGLATIHRMHRLYAAQEMITDVPDTDLILTGHMGGEVMKGIFFDDLITSPYVRRRWSGESKQLLLRETLVHAFIKEDGVNHDEVQKLIEQEPYWGTEENINHFLFSFILKAGLHHSQDVALISRNVTTCLPVFLDLDFLDILFKSKYSMLHNESRMRNPFKRIHAYELNCSMIMDLYPPLAKIPLGKRGMFTPEEYFGNKIILMLKRARRYKSSRAFKSSYTIGDWLKDYTTSLIPHMMQSELSDFIDFKQYREKLKSLMPGMPEKYWLRFTNAVLYYLLIGEINEI